MPPPQFILSLSRRFTNHYAGHPFRLVTFTIKSLCILHVFTEYGYDIEPTQGASMLPTLEVVGDYVLTNRSYRRGNGVKVGDIVAFQSVVHPGEKVIKRVVGMAGDYVMRDTPGSRSDCMIQVPEGHCWVVGDNLPFSRDSRHFGPMPMALIRAKVEAKVLPWSERKWLENGLQSVSVD